MNAATLIQLALFLAQTVLANLKKTGTTAIAQQAITDIEAAIAALEKVQGTDVTFAQLESLRVKPTW